MTAVAWTLVSLAAAGLCLFPRRRQEDMISSVMAGAAGLHTLLILSVLVLRRPSNLFTRLGIPINAPVDRIRALLVEEARFNTVAQRGAIIAPLEIPKDIDTLLKRLGVHGSRETYARFGQRAMQTLLLDYLRTATLLLLLTTNINGRQRWRTNVLGALTCAFLAEVYAFTSASAMPLEKDANTAFMWHDNLFLARNMLFLALPIFIQVLPAIYPPPPASAVLAPALKRLEATLPRARLLKYARQAVLRQPYTRERVVEYWANDAAEGATARNDLNMQMTASKLGFGFASPTSSGDKVGQESALRVNARMAVQSLKPLFMPPPN